MLDPLDQFPPLSTQEVDALVAAFRRPDLRAYPELVGYSRDRLYEGCVGGGGLYLAARMARALDLRRGQVVLDLGCGSGSSSIFLSERFGVQVVALDVSTPEAELRRRFEGAGVAEHVEPVQADATQPLPFAECFFDAVFCMNSFNFYGGSVEFLAHLLAYLRPGGRLAVGGEVLSDELTPAQRADPPLVYAFRLPPPNEHVDVFREDFMKQHTAAWWRQLFGRSGLVQVELCEELADADVLYEELVRYEHEHRLDPFDVRACLAQMEWGRTGRPRKSLFLLAASKV